MGLDGSGADGSERDGKGRTGRTGRDGTSRCCQRKGHCNRRLHHQEVSAAARVQVVASQSEAQIYSLAQKRARVKFARAVLRLSQAQLRAKLSMSMDGVVLSMPPTIATDRFNYCWGAATHMWRKRTEGNLPQLAGANDFEKQLPLGRAIPLWGGISEDGVAPIFVPPCEEDEQG